MSGLRFVLVFFCRVFFALIAAAAELVKEEYLQLKLQQEIAQEVEAKITKTRRTAMLHEQLHVIKKELGLVKGAPGGRGPPARRHGADPAAPDDKEALVEKFKARLATRKLPAAAQVWCQVTIITIILLFF